jgi:serine/threonine protein kinase
MHANGFAHADIKALNVFVDRDANGDLQCYLGDFGLSQILDDSHLVVKAMRIFNIKGFTMGYAAPELLKRFKEKYDESNAAAHSKWTAEDFKRVDVFALGILLWEIVNCKNAW